MRAQHRLEARSSERSVICWKCHEAVQGPVCASCGALQPPPPEPDLFAVLGLERRYTVDLQGLESAWRAASRKVHPDRFVGRRAVERRMSLQWTAAINEARRVLRDDERRAWYLATGNPRPPERGGPSPDPEFLEAMFELRFEAEAGDAAALETARGLQAALQEEIAALFASWEAGDGDLSEAPERLIRLRYLNSMLNEHDQH